MSDWPLSREEKTFRLLRLYAQDVQAADELLEAGESRRENMHAELLKALPTGARNSRCTRLSDASTAATEVTLTENGSASADASAERLRLAVEEATAALRALIPDGTAGLEEFGKVGRLRARSEGASSYAASVRGSPENTKSRRGSGARRPVQPPQQQRRRRSRGGEAPLHWEPVDLPDSSEDDDDEDDACHGDCEFEPPRRKTFTLERRKQKPKTTTRASSCHATVIGASSGGSNESKLLGVSSGSRALPPLASLESFLGESVSPFPFAKP